MAVSRQGTRSVAVLLKRVDLRATVDPLTGVIAPDPHGGLSASDQCALELALQAGERDGLPVHAFSAGGAASDDVLRVALAAGVDEVVRVDINPDAPSSVIAAALTPLVTSALYIFCGDYSLDRGTGSVPAFVAGILGFAQVLGSASVAFMQTGLRIERRLDRGRREVVTVTPPTVVSVEGGLEPLRRASLQRSIQSASFPVPVLSSGQFPASEPGRTRPLRPRPHVLNGPDPALPAHQRLLMLSGALTVFDPPRVVQASPEEAADELLAFMTARGYLD